VGEVPAEAVLYISKPEAGDEMVLLSFIEVRAILGGRSPLFEDVTSN
jgi:hypothetical protein